MLLVQRIGRPSDVKNCPALAVFFIGKVDELAAAYDEIQVIFYGYDIDNSLKAATCELRQGGKKTSLVVRVKQHAGTDF